MPHASRQSSSPAHAPSATAAVATTAGSPAAAKDYVTALETRGLLEERLAAILPAREPLAMAIIDVVGLKAVNERDGFLAGDSMLRAAADRLRGAATEADLLARLGGDELVALFLGPRADEAARRAAGELAGGTAHPALRAAALSAADGETSAELIERLYATLRRC